MDLFIVIFLPLILSQVLGQDNTSDRSVVGARLGWPTQQLPDGAGGSLDSTGGPRIVLFLRTQGTVLLTKPYYSGTELVLK